MIFESGQDILCLETWKKTKKNFNLKKKSKMNFFLAALVSFLPFIPLYLQIYKFSIAKLAILNEVIFNKSY